MEKPLGTPDMSARETEDMVNSVLRDSPLPDPERSDEKLPEEDGSGKLPKEGRGEKLPEEIPTCKLIMPCTEGVLPFVFPLV